ncbi:MAG: hypothetical protein IV100_32430 [Myxococcales bacterium]|nr:hypothetical protein [Myxococcales bacterium]
MRNTSYHPVPLAIIAAYSLSCGESEPFAAPSPDSASTGSGDVAELNQEPTDSDTEGGPSSLELDVRDDDAADSPDAMTTDLGSESVDASSAVDVRAAEGDASGADAGPACVPYAPGCGDLPTYDLATSKTQHPIVLVHGMGGFDSLGPVPYFVGVADDLAGLGYAVFTTVADPFNGSDVRAAQIAPQLDHILACTCAEKVDLIGHSQGGIDARVLVSELGYGDRIAAVATVATPHGGSTVAAQLLDLAPESVDPLIDLLGGFLAGLYADPLEETKVRDSLLWCSPEFLADRFAKAPIAPDVAWFSYGGRAGLTATGSPDCDGAALPNPEAKTPISASMLAGWTALGGLDGVANDGLVTVESAKYGEFRGCVPADHMQEIGLSLGSALKLYDHLTLYREIAQLFVDRGY